MLSAKNAGFGWFMIYYTTTKNDCLLSIMQCVSNGKAKFWFSDVVPFSKFQNLIPKLILEYDLDLGEQERKKKSDYGSQCGVWWSIMIRQKVRCSSSGYLPLVIVKHEEASWR